MSLKSVLGRARRAAEAIMTDSCTIQHQTGTVYDPDTFQEVPTYETVYAGKCRVQSRNLGTESPDAGQQRLDLYSLELQVPITVTGVAVGDQVTVASELDPDLDGRQFVIRNLFHASHKSARRYPIEEVTS